MSREAVDKALELARRGFESGVVEPAKWNFEGRQCCLLGAAAVAAGANRTTTNPRDYAVSLGMTWGEAWGLMSGWDGVSRQSSEDEYAYSVARRLRDELNPREPGYDDNTPEAEPD